MLGTSARIGEVLAIRRRDIDITGPVPSIRLAGTIVSRNGEPTFRQDHPKTAKSRRIVALPTFASDAVRQRLAKVGSMGLDSLVFQSRDGTPLTTANVRRCRHHLCRAPFALCRRYGPVAIRVTARRAMTAWPRQNRTSADTAAARFSARPGCRPRR